ncbi:MAG: adenylate/guanylate cyclase domain-containing protein [bacterium]|nr:adenylate/guanylate cyclase domain-containing protein [bacterium]
MAEGHPAIITKPEGALELRTVITGTFRNLVFSGLGGLFLVVTGVTALTGTLVFATSRDMLSNAAMTSVSELTSREAELLDQPFVHIASLARLLQRDQEAILAAPELHLPPRGPITLRVAPNGNLYKAEKNGGASFWAAARLGLTPGLRTFALQTEAFDPLMQAVLDQMPDHVAAVYFNGPEGLNRYLPYIDDVHQVFSPDVVISDFNFYYVADEVHDPRGLPRWTDAYLDPAGQGWMVTCAIPIRQGGRLRGVTGIDMTLGKLVRTVTEIPLPLDGTALLTNATGQILAMSHGLERVLGLQGWSDQDRDGKPLTRETLQPERFRVQRLEAPGARAFFEQALRDEQEVAPIETRIGDRVYVVSQGRLAEAGWRLFVFTPRESLLAPLEVLRSRGVLLMVCVLGAFVATGLVGAVLLYRRAGTLAGAIADPLHRLSDETGRVGTTANRSSFEDTGIEELDTLSRNFARMARELDERQKAQLEAEVARTMEIRSSELLQKVLPAPIVERLMTAGGVIADAHEAVTVLFADVVDFTPLAASTDPGTIVRMLDALFADFDALVKRHGLEKIKTIGDAYMAVAGVPYGDPDHAVNVARVALEMLEVSRHHGLGGQPLELRIGIHSGPAVAGVIGRDKFLYDLWGDTVNVASRIESHGLPGRIQISEETRGLLGQRFVVEPRGIVNLKGRGSTQTYWLIAEIEGSKGVPTAEVGLPSRMTPDVPPPHA